MFMETNSHFKQVNTSPTPSCLVNLTKTQTIPDINVLNKQERNGFSYILRLRSVAGMRQYVTMLPKIWLDMQLNYADLRQQTVQCNLFLHDNLRISVYFFFFLQNSPSVNTHGWSQPCREHDKYHPDCSCTVENEKQL